MNSVLRSAFVTSPARRPGSSASPRTDMPDDHDALDDDGRAVVAGLLAELRQRGPAAFLGCRGLEGPLRLDHVAGQLEQWLRGAVEAFGAEENEYGYLSRYAGNLIGVPLRRTSTLAGLDHEQRRVRFGDERLDLLTMAAQPPLDLGGRTVAESHPDDLGRRTEQGRTATEVAVLRPRWTPKSGH